MSIIKSQICDLKGTDISMRDYSISGDFGSVKLYPTAIPSQRFCSLDHILHMGRHCVNNLYRIDRPHGTDSNLLLLTFSGKGFVSVKNAEFIAQPETVFLVPKHQKSSYGALPGENWNFFWIHYSGEHTQACTEDILAGGTYGFPMNQQEIKRYIGVFDRCITQGIERELEESITLNNILTALLHSSILQQHNQKENLLVAEMLQFMENNLSSDCSLSALTEKYHYSKEYMIRLFKNSVGMTPYHYWRQLRLQHSCNALIKDSSSTIKQIA